MAVRPCRPRASDAFEAAELASVPVVGRPRMVVATDVSELAIQGGNRTNDDQ